MFTFFTIFRCYSDAWNKWNCCHQRRNQWVVEITSPLSHVSQRASHYTSSEGTPEVSLSRLRKCLHWGCNASDVYCFMFSIGLLYVWHYFCLLILIYGLIKRVEKNLIILWEHVFSFVECILSFPIEMVHQMFPHFQTCLNRSQ